MRPAVCMAIALALAGCATAPRSPESVDWAARQSALEAVPNWRMTGRVAVAVDGQGASGSLDWRQAGGTSELAISGPFGAGALRVTLGPQGMRLEDAAGTWVEGAEAERLLADRLGTAVPVASLRYWVLGVPAPGQPFAGAAGGAAVPGAFEQSGWQVSVERWHTVAGLLLPARLTAGLAGARIKLAVSRWDLAP